MLLTDDSRDINGQSLSLSSGCDAGAPLLRLQVLGGSQADAALVVSQRVRFGVNFGD